jgi:hypothetical protein
LLKVSGWHTVEGTALLLFRTHKHSPPPLRNSLLAKSPECAHRWFICLEMGQHIYASGPDSIPSDTPSTQPAHAPKLKVFLRLHRKEPPPGSQGW